MARYTRIREPDAKNLLVAFLDAGYRWKAETGAADGLAAGRNKLNWLSPPGPDLPHILVSRSVAPGEPEQWRFYAEQSWGELGALLADAMPPGTPGRAKWLTWLVKTEEERALAGRDPHLAACLSDVDASMTELEEATAELGALIVEQRDALDAAAPDPSSGMDAHTEAMTLAGESGEWEQHRQLFEQGPPDPYASGERSLEDDLEREA